MIILSRDGFTETSSAQAVPRQDAGIGIISFPMLPQASRLWQHRKGSMSRPEISLHNSKHISGQDTTTFILY
jgi:hypothetical protein